MVLLQNGSPFALSRRGWWLYGLTSLSAAISAGYALAGLASDGGGSSRYAAARSVVLLVAVLTGPLWRSRPVLVLLGLVMAGVQAVDAVVGVWVGEVPKIVGPAALAVAGAALAVSYARGSAEARVPMPA